MFQTLTSPTTAPFHSRLSTPLWESIRDQVLPWAVPLLALLVLFAIGLGVSRLLGTLTRAGHIPPPMTSRIRKILWWLILAIFLTGLLQNSQLFEQAWAVLSATLVALAVGFVALWSVLSNVVCALLIIAFRPFQMGDQVELLEPSDVGSGLEGRVVDLSLMFTTLELAGDAETRVLVRVPNTVFFQKAVKVTFPKEGPRSTFFGTSS